MSSSPPSVSAVMAVHNGAAYIREALQSILAQTVPVSEIIVVDDGSADESAAIAREFPRVRVLSKSHSGVAETLNRGIAAATGEFLTFLDSDDLWAERKLEWQLEALGRPDAPEIVFGLAQQFHSPEMDATARAAVFCPAEPMAAAVLSGLLVRRRDFLRVGLLVTQWQFGEFVEWYARAMDAGLRSAFLHELTLFRRLHANNTSRRRKSARPDFAHVMKSILDRRRQPGTTGSDPFAPT